MDQGRKVAIELLSGTISREEAHEWAFDLKQQTDRGEAEVMEAAWDVVLLLNDVNGTVEDGYLQSDEQIKNEFVALGVFF